MLQIRVTQSFSRHFMLDWAPRKTKYNRQLISDIAKIVDENPDVNNQMRAFANLFGTYRPLQSYEEHSSQQLYFWQEGVLWNRVTTAIKSLQKIQLICKELIKDKASKDTWIYGWMDTNVSKSDSEFQQ